MDFWAVIANVASVVIILTGVFTLIGWWRTPAHKLEAFVAWNSFELPPQVRSEFAGHAKPIADMLAKFLEENPEKEIGTRPYWHVKTLASELRYLVETDLSPDLRYLHGCWVARVKNAGKRKCVDVNLRLPHAKKASIKHDRESEEHALDISEVINVGELRPKGECNIIAWTDRQLYNWDYASLHVTHESGVGKIRGEWRVDRFTYVFGNVARGLGILLFVFAVSFMLLQLVYWLASARQATPTATPTPTPTVSVSGPLPMAPRTAAQSAVPP